MKEHALPQDIVGYKFHLIGNMTLKQFAEVAVGVVVGFLIYQTNLPLVIKIPLILFSAGAGAMAAFVPFEERPLDHWITEFVRAIYRPTQFYWQKVNKIPEPFLYEVRKELNTIIKDIDLSPARRQRVKEFLHSIGTSDALDDYDRYDQQRLSEVSGLFGDTPTPALVFSPELTPASDIPPVITDLETEFAMNNPYLSSSLTDTPSTAIPTPVAPQIDNQPPSVATPPSSLENEAVFLTIPTPPAVSTPSSDSPTSSTFSQPTPIIIPEAGEVRVQPVESIHYEEVQQTPASIPEVQTFVEASSSSAVTPNDVIPAIFNADLPFPFPSDKPNTFIGMVLDDQRLPIGKAIINVVDESGRTLLAATTNPLGQFFVTTPLQAGRYFLQAQAGDHSFPTYVLDLNNEILPPIEVDALSGDNGNTPSPSTESASGFITAA